MKDEMLQNINKNNVKKYLRINFSNFVWKDMIFVILSTLYY